MSLPRFLRTAVLAALATALAGALAGCYLQHGGPAWSAGAQTVDVPLVVSHLRTDEMTRSLEARVTAELRRRASQGDLGGLTLVRTAGDLTLAVELVEVAQKVIRVDLYNVPIERQVVIRAQYTLTGPAGETLAQGTADSRVSALAGNYDISRGENSEQGRDSAIANIAQAIIEAINDDRLKVDDQARRLHAAGEGEAIPARDPAPVPAELPAETPVEPPAPEQGKASTPAPEPPPAIDLPTAPAPAPAPAETPAEPPAPAP